MIGLTLDSLRRLWPHGDQHQTGLMEGMVASAPAVFEKYKVDSDLILCHLMGNVSEECGAGLELTENLNYSAQGLMRTWPSRFGLARALNYAHNPERIADAVYNGRMGNRPGTHDGYVYRGHGGTQITGLDAYRQAEELTGLPLVDHPEIASDPEHFMLVAVVDFAVICKDREGKTCLDYARENNFEMVVRVLNGGLIGYGDRLNWFRRWRAELKV